MLHVTCDLCGKKLRPAEDHHYVVKIEAYAAHDPAEITEEDLDEDHMEAVSQLLRDMEDSEEEGAVEPASRRLRYDLCPECRTHYLHDPLRKEAAARPAPKEAAQKFGFSEN